MPIGMTAKLAIIAISDDRRLIICKLIDQINILKIMGFSFFKEDDYKHRKSINKNEFCNTEYSNINSEF